MNHNLKIKKSTVPTRKKLISAALKLFVKKGYYGTSISDISKATKLSKAAIYFHFKNKDALLKSILEEYERIFMDRMIEEVESRSGEVIEKFTCLLRFVLNFPIKNREICLFLVNLSTELFDDKKKYEREINGIYKKYYNFFSGLLEKGKEEGLIGKNYNLRILTLILIGLLEGNLLQWNMNRNSINSEQYSRSFMKFFLNGILKSN